MSDDKIRARLQAGAIILLAACRGSTPGNSGGAGSSVGGATPGGLGGMSSVGGASASGGSMTGGSDVMTTPDATDGNDNVRSADARDSYADARDGSAGTRDSSADGNAPSADGAVSDANSQTAPVVQIAPGDKPPLPLGDNFDGLAGPMGNPTDDSLAVGPNHIVQVINWTLAIYTKRGAMYPTTGTSLRGPVPSNSIFAGFGGRCEGNGSTADAIDRGDMAVRYDQLAQRWVFLQPVFRAPYAMCYAVSDTADPLGTYHRYEFARSLFPDFPRLGIWPDGYYVGTSTGDDVVQKHLCVADRARMIAGQPATERCMTVEGVNFLNPGDVDGSTAPPAGAPDIVLALGGNQLGGVFEDDGVYVYKARVDWAAQGIALTGPSKITVARYHYLCDGQLTSCVPQPGTTRRLDAQGDKLMPRVSYRNFGDHQSLVVAHSVNGPAGGGGLRWYELRIDASGNVFLHQQSTYAPDASFRWLGSAAMDGRGNIGIGYSFGSATNSPGQRFTARAAGDPLGVLTFRETTLAAGQASQTDTLRWEDFTTIALDPSDDSTFWYVGDYLRASSQRVTRIGSFRVP